MKAVFSADVKWWAWEGPLNVQWFDSHVFFFFVVFFLLFFFWFSSQGIIILVRMMDSVRIIMLIALIVSLDLVASVSRYPWWDHEMFCRQGKGRVGQKQRERGGLSQLNVFIMQHINR